MNKLSNLSLTIKINKPVKSVWSALVDWQGQSDWMLQTKVWSELDQDRTVKNGKGVLIFAFTGLSRWVDLERQYLVQANSKTNNRLWCRYSQNALIQQG